MPIKWKLENIYNNPQDTSADLQILKQKIEDLLDYIANLKKNQNNLTEERILFIIKEYEKIIELHRKLQSYVTCILSTDSQNEIAQKIRGTIHYISSSLIILNIELEKITSNIKFDVPNYEYFVQKLIENSKHRMKDDEEELYSKLFISSSNEWKSLYNELISNIKVEFENEIISISKLRNFYNHPDRTLRQKAYNKELQIFKEYEYIFSKILNSVKWDSIVISQKRKFNSLLDKSLFENDMDKEILDIVLSTTFENLNIIRKYFHKKASLINLEKLEWFDLSAPIYDDRSVIFDFEKAKNLILDNFARFSNEMYELALKAFNEGWIDAEPRLGKTDGGFCIYIFSNQSRILVNYDNSIKSLLTLAHELGHAYHNYVMSENTAVYRYSPLILAETASILAETITRKNALENLSDPKTQIIILDGYLYTVSVVTVDIISRFLFEDKVIKIREQRILTPSELCNIMIDSQREVYLDSINSYHPYMWANKPHYYTSNYYNYPYLVGLLVGLSLYNLYESNKISAKDYREILKNSGKDKPERILKNFGLDIRSKNFWQEAFDLITKDIEEFDRLPPV